MRERERENSNENIHISEASFGPQTIEFTDEWNAVFLSLLLRWIDVMRSSAMFQFKSKFEDEKKEYKGNESNHIVSDDERIKNMEAQTAHQRRPKKLECVRRV